MSGSGNNRTSNDGDSDNENDGWKVGLLAAAGTAVLAGLTGLGYYLGSQNREPNRPQCHSYQTNSSTSTTSRAGVPQNSHVHDNCSICLSKIKPVQRLNCGHTFHTDCISGWLPQNPTCPICRKRQQ